MINEDKIVGLVINNLLVNNIHLNAPKLKSLSESNRINLSEGLKHHLDNNIPITENIYRVYSNEFFGIYNESRQLYNEGVLEVTGVDLDLIKTDLGQIGIFEGEEVYLDIPFLDNVEEYLVEVKHRGKNVKLNKPFRTPSGPKKFAVYVKTPKGTIKKVTFGDPNMRIRNNDKAAAKSFRARHKCSEKKDRTKAGYWSCNITRYRKALGIKSSNPW